MTESKTILEDRLLYGCMRLPVTEPVTSRSIIEQAWQTGIRHFDHADIYGGGECERIFGQCWKELGLSREDIILTSKSGIRFAGDPTTDDPKRYDFSQRSILRSVESSLERLQTDYLDHYLLHRPDFLMRPTEVAATFSKLHSAGKVRSFGVSNFMPSQVILLNQELDFPITTNQVEINLLNLDALFNGTLDQCQQHGITAQAWSPLAGSYGQASSERERRIHKELSLQAQTYGVRKWVVALCWLLKHPAQIQAILGTNNLARISEAAGALDLEYSRSDWYRLLEASTGSAVP